MKSLRKYFAPSKPSRAHWDSIGVPEIICIPIQDIRVLFSPFVKMSGNAKGINPLETALNDIQTLLENEKQHALTHDQLRFDDCINVLEKLAKTPPDFIFKSKENTAKPENNGRVPLLESDLQILEKSQMLFPLAKARLDEITPNQEDGSRLLRFRKNLEKFCEEHTQPYDYSRHTTPTAATRKTNAPGLPLGRR